MGEGLVDQVPTGPLDAAARAELGDLRKRARQVDAHAIGVVVVADLEDVVAVGGCENRADPAGLQSVLVGAGGEALQPLPSVENGNGALGIGLVARVVPKQRLGAVPNSLCRAILAILAAFSTRT